MNPQENATAARDDALVRAKHQQSLRAMAESMQIARETAHTLSMQSEQLARTEREVEDAQLAVDMSKRVLRGMTWSGWLYNAVTSAPQLDKATPAPAGDGVAPSGKPNAAPIAMGFICPECKVVFQRAEELAAHYGVAHDRPPRDAPSGRGAASLAPAQAQGRQAAGQSMRDDRHDAFLRDLEPQLAELKEASRALGHALDTQNHQLDRIDTRIDTLNDGMKRVSVQAKKMAGQKLRVVFRFRCAFQEVETRKFLRDVDGEAVLGAEVLSEGCTFRAYTLGEDTEIWGFQSERTSFFLGVNRLGYLKIRGGDLQSYEQFFIDHGKATTGLFCMASYFGLGGWVVRKDDTRLSIVRGSVENKASAAQFKLLNLDQIRQEIASS
ncbi:hypothetical protein ATCC90586_007778 [Pythium insidiosum]|nr:hypothetical protein ATCC90586_007778 [Pythium insidiosum]